MEVMELRKVYILIILSLLYLTLSLACDPLDFRLISIGSYSFTGAAFIFPALYIVLDSITRTSGKYMAIRLVFFFHLFDGLFTYLLYTINLLPAPTTFKFFNAYLSIVSPMPRLFWSGIIGAILSGIVEVLIYAFLQNKIKSFFISSVSATILIMLAHNLPTDYLTFHKLYPNIYMHLIIFNFSVNCLSVIVCSLMLSMFFSKQKDNFLKLQGDDKYYL